MLHVICPCYMSQAGLRCQHMASALQARLQCVKGLRFGSSINPLLHRYVQWIIFSAHVQAKGLPRQQPLLLFHSISLNSLRDSLRWLGQANIQNCKICVRNAMRGKLVISRASLKVGTNSNMLHARWAVGQTSLRPSRALTCLLQKFPWHAPHQGVWQQHQQTFRISTLDAPPLPSGLHVKLVCWPWDMLSSRPSPLPLHATLHFTRHGEKLANRCPNYCMLWKLVRQLSRHRMKPCGMKHQQRKFVEPANAVLQTWHRPVSVMLNLQGGIGRSNPA